MPQRCGSPVLQFPCNQSIASAKGWMASMTQTMAISSFMLIKVEPTAWCLAQVMRGSMMVGSNLTVTGWSTQAHIKAVARV